MEINQKYVIFNFLDDCEEPDYLYKIHATAKEFAMTLDDAEWFVRGWHQNDANYVFCYELMKKLSQIYGKPLNNYNKSQEFWDDILGLIDQPTLQLLLFISENQWLGGLNDLISKRTKVLISK